ncbi:MAG: calcium/sodium antiporter [Candidatus Thermoplasmatota archaeon]|nr:calcium/sodium antiporter [Candidatus Thermoplasmatota archaeon]
MQLGLAFLLSIAGFFFLWKGADWLVEGAASLALAAKVSTIVVGITVVAFGTSLPEMAVSLAASVKGEPEITLGNVIGSNIANILLVLGIAAMVSPIKVDKHVVTRDTMLVLGSGVLILLLAMTGNLTRVHGLIMLGAFVGYLAYYVRDAINHKTPGVPDLKDYHPGRSIVMLAGGIICILIGSDILVDSAVFIAESYGISPAIIGLTMIAVGTSLPELATSAVASRKGESDISIGNVLGSNVFNTLLVLGLATFLFAGSIPVDPALLWDIGLMAVVCLFLVPTLWTGHTLTRQEGALMLVIYIVYIVSLAYRQGLV